MFSDPIKNLKAFAIRETDVVADLGAGTGFYAIPAAQIAARGKVYAVEISKDYLKTITNKIKEAKLENIECLWGDVEHPGGTKLGDRTADKVIASNIFFQVGDKNSFIGEIRRILKDRGELLLIDWADETPLAPKALLIPKHKAKEMFEKAGFSLEREIDAGAHHYGMIFKRA